MTHIKHQWPLTKRELLEVKGNLRPSFYRKRTSNRLVWKSHNERKMDVFGGIVPSIISYDHHWKENTPRIISTMWALNGPVQCRDEHARICVHTHCSCVCTSLPLTPVLPHHSCFPFCDTHYLSLVSVAAINIMTKLNLEKEGKYGQKLKAGT